MRRRMAFAVAIPLTVVAVLLVLRLTDSSSSSSAPSGAGPVGFEDSLSFAITEDRLLRVSTSRADICLAPDGDVHSDAKDTLRLSLLPDAHCTRPDAGEPVDVPLPAGLDVTKVTRVLVVADSRAYPSYAVDNALYEVGTPA